jgi:hypothetical protein
LIDKYSFLVGNAGRNIRHTEPGCCRHIPFKEYWNFQIRLDFQNVFHNYDWSNPTTASRSVSRISAQGLATDSPQGSPAIVPGLCSIYATVPWMAREEYTVQKLKIK